MIKSYELKTNLIVRIPSLHMPEAHFLYEDQPLPAHILILGLHIYNNFKMLLESGQNICF